MIYLVSKTWVGPQVAADLHEVQYHVVISPIISVVQ